MLTICQAVCLSQLRDNPSQNCHQISRATDGVFAVETCRASLKRLERGNLVDSKSVTHPPGMCGSSSIHYQITDRGREELEGWLDQIAPMLFLGENDDRTK